MQRYQHPEYLIDAQELATLLGSDKLRLFDATVIFSQQSDGTLTAAPGLDAYNAGHIPGAAFFDHMSHFADGSSKLRNTLLPIAALQDAIGQAGIGADDQVVLYSSQYLMWATRAWWMLHYAGHNNVRVLNGGLAAWNAAGQSLETQTNSYAPTTFTGTPRAERYVDKETIASAIDSPACTIDALPADVYAGTSPRHYGRPGHIPGAGNLPYHHLQEGEGYLPAAALQVALQERGMLGASQVYTYCGGGIAATVDALGCLLCGQEQVAVYDGSMSEWSLDAQKPVNTGTAP